MTPPCRRRADGGAPPARAAEQGDTLYAAHATTDGLGRRVLFGWLQAGPPLLGRPRRTFFSVLTSSPAQLAVAAHSRPAYTQLYTQLRAIIMPLSPTSRNLMRCVAGCPYDNGVGACPPHKL